MNRYAQKGDAAGSSVTIGRKGNIMQSISLYRTVCIIAVIFHYSFGSQTDSTQKQIPVQASNAADTLASSATPQALPVDTPKPKITEVSATSLPDMFSALIRDVKASKPQSIAIFPFSDSIGNPGRMIAEYGVSFLSQNPMFKAVDDYNFSLAMEQLKVTPSGYATVNGLILLKAATILSAAYIITGSVDEQDNRCMVRCVLQKADNGDTVAQASVRLPAKEVRRFLNTKLCTMEIVPHYAVVHSIFLPGWGQFHYHHYVRGVVFLSLAVAGIGGLVYTIADHQKYADEVQLYRKHDPSTVQPGQSAQEWAASANRALDMKNRAATQVNLAIAGVSTLWALNIIDALLTDRIFQKKRQAVYFSYSSSLDNSFQAHITMKVTCAF
jgi:hypothetical protein